MAGHWTSRVLVLSGLTEACSKQPRSLRPSTERFVNHGKGGGRQLKRDARRLFPVPPARPEPLVHVGRRGTPHGDRLFIPGDRPHDLGEMKMQPRLAEA